LLISIVIPTYNEGDLYNTLSYLTVQTVFTKYKEGDVEIIIADCDPEDNKKTLDSYIKFINKYPNFNKITKFIDVDRKGIAYQRHMGILASKGNIIVNFDADAYFSSPKGIQYLINPILKNQGCVLTCCDNLLNIHEVKDPFILQHENMFITRNTLEILNNIQRIALIVCLEPGMTFTRQAYDYVNGFNDVKQGEAIFMTPRMIYSFGLNSKQHVSEVQIISSPRRAVAAAKLGILSTFGNYDSGFRLGNNNNIDRV
jgi:glycosyltransferase involved in cell wall biosynthesis